MKDKATDNGPNNENTIYCSQPVSDYKYCSCKDMSIFMSGQCVS